MMMSDDAPPGGIPRPRIPIKHRGQGGDYPKKTRPLLKKVDKPTQEAVDSDPTPPSGTERPPSTPFFLS